MKHVTIGLIVVFLSRDTSSECACNFPSGLTGTWVRSRDSLSLTFTSNTVAGLAVTYNNVDLGTFSCDTLSSGRYLIASSPYQGTVSMVVYYICWQIVSVAEDSFILYELSDDIATSGYDSRPGYVLPSGETLDVASACPQSTSTKLFTTLVKSGASSSSVAADCPASVQASFKYDTCSVASLAACSDTSVVSADYSLCSTTVFGSVGGSLSCMGYATYQSEVYVNLYDSGSIKCWKLPNGDTAADMTTTYYSGGDCTTTSGGSTTLELYYSAECPASSSSVSAGVIAGATIGSIAFVALIGVAVFYFLTKIKRKQRINSAESKDGYPEKQQPQSTTNPPVEIKIPDTTPEKPSGLPPLQLNGNAATGEALRS